MRLALLALHPALAFGLRGDWEMVGDLADHEASRDLHHHFNQGALIVPTQTAMGKLHDHLEGDPHTAARKGGAPPAGVSDTTYKWLSAIMVIFIVGALVAVRLLNLREREITLATVQVKG
ncbi:hypothetical protein JCM24511_03922 [Saitozyma sp. JCM 24511]|nr:hypothetical protein JCM24511_03922 [Saitozyma sp. JCM 24511]